MANHPHVGPVAPCPALDVFDGVAAVPVLVGAIKLSVLPVVVAAGAVLLFVVVAEGDSVAAESSSSSPAVITTGKKVIKSVPRVSIDVAINWPLPPAISMQIADVVP
jgi:hypothetical protein